LTFSVLAHASRGLCWRAWRPFPPIVFVMKTFLVIAMAATLAGCGLETASTAATAASIKKQELQEGKKTMERAQQKIDGAMQQAQQRAGSSD
jgi:curli biogenesis system outer membrane secretion channel CsgG